MTDTNTLAPADAEILDAAEDFRSQYTHGGTTFDEFDALDFARAVLAKWGQPAPASQPVAVPAQAGEPWYGHKFKEQHRGIWRCECGKTVKETTADWLDMSADELRNLRTETAALCADYDAARAVLAKWGTPQPTQAQAGAVPLDEARRLFDAGWKAAALFCDREDVVADGIIGFGACPQFEAVIGAAYPLRGKQ